jgi:ribA/ribD-fused uncharacterized protein
VIALDPPIEYFFEDYRFLSNFWLVDIPWGELGGELVFPSTENAYQALKSLDSRAFKAFVGMTPGQAKRAGKKAPIRGDWDDVKLRVMTRLIDIKFDIPEMAAMLESTGDAVLIEGNTWGDTFWGQSPIGNGKNHLGKIIMNKRDRLRDIN